MKERLLQQVWRFVDMQRECIHVHGPTPKPPDAEVPGGFLFEPAFDPDAGVVVRVKSQIF